MQLRLEPTVSAGTLIHLGVLLLALAGFYYGLVQRIDRTERRVRTLFKWTKELIKKTPGVDAAVIASMNGEDE